MGTKSKAVLRVDLSDVVKAGGVAEAIFDACKNSDTISSGYTQSAESGTTFCCQWHEGLSVDGYAARTMVGGAVHYIDHSDGRMISSVPVNEVDGEWCTENGDVIDSDDVHHDNGGGNFVVGDWTDESVVELLCPDAEEALERPDFAAEMAQAVIDRHGALSDKRAWKSLIEQIQAAGGACRQIDADELV